MFDKGNTYLICISQAQYCYLATLAASVKIKMIIQNTYCVILSVRNYVYSTGGLEDIVPLGFVPRMRHTGTHLSYAK